MKSCEHKLCNYLADFRVKFYKNGELISVSLCEKHMHDCITQGLAYRHRTRFKIHAVIPYEEFGYYD